MGIRPGTSPSRQVDATWPYNGLFVQVPFSRGTFRAYRRTHSGGMLRARDRHRLAWGGAMAQRRGVADHPSIARVNTLAQLCNPCFCHFASVTAATPNPPSLKVDPATELEAGGFEPVARSIISIFAPPASGRLISNSRSRLFTSRSFRSPLGLTNACVITYPESLEASTILSPGRKWSRINFRTQYRGLG